MSINSCITDRLKDVFYFVLQVSNVLCMRHVLRLAVDDRHLRH